MIRSILPLAVPLAVASLSPTAFAAEPATTPVATAPADDARLKELENELREFVERCSRDLQEVQAELQKKPVAALDGATEKVVSMSRAMASTATFDASSASLRAALAEVKKDLAELDPAVAELANEPSVAASVEKLRTLGADLKVLQTDFESLEQPPPATKPKPKPKPKPKAKKKEKAEAAEKATDEAPPEAPPPEPPNNEQYLNLAERLRPALSVRCKTAYCFGGEGSTEYGIEPVLDLPFGLVWALGEGSLPNYINSHAVNIEFNVGMRFWFAYDQVSLMVYLSRPLIESSDPIRLQGDPYEHSPSALRRPYPSLGIGMFGDIVLLGISYDELRNGGGAQRDLNYPPNEVLGRTLTFSLGFSLLNAARNAAGDDDANKKASAPKGGGK